MNRMNLLIAALMALSVAPVAQAHQTVSSNGARVTMHVNPDDEPQAGVPTSIRVLSVKVPSGGRFSFSSCRCRVLIKNSSATTLLSRAMTTRTTFEFPSAGAYQITYSGQYRRSGRTKKFAARFAIRAS